MKLRLHYIFWTLIYFRGLMELFKLPSELYKLGIPLTIMLLFLIKKKKYIFPGGKIFIVFLFFTLLSFVANKMGVFLYIYFIFYVTSAYFYFIIIYNEKDIRIINRIIGYLKIIFIIQIIASIIKFLLVGVLEDFVGTMSTSAGSLTTLFVLFAISIVFAHYLYKECTIYQAIVLTLGFIFFGIAGNKRAIAFMIPVIMILLYVFFLYLNKRLFMVSNIKKVLMISLISAISFYSIVRLLPSFNAEKKIGGRFDLEYVFDFAESYTSSEGKSVEEMRRLEGLFYLPRLLLHKGNIDFLLGDGPGILLPSKFRKDLSGGSVMNQLYGVRYGGRMGLIWLWVQIGLLGTFFYLFFLGYLIRKAIKRQKNNSVKLIVLILSLIVVFDISFYSYEFVKNIHISGIFFFILAIAMKNLNLNIFEKNKQYVK